ncbi:Protein vip1, variant 2 [Umbelopsis sp. WA50703]
MPAWKSVIIPSEPSPNYVVVSHIAGTSSEKTILDFFQFCGKIKEFELVKDDDEKHQVALIHFERESAAKTAVLLSNALIDDSHIVVAPYFISTENSSDKEDETTTQEDKPKTRIIAELLAHGYMLQDQVVAKGLEYDRKYAVQSRVTSYLTGLQTRAKQLDDKYRIWGKALELDQKYKIQEKAQGAFNVAQAKAQEALNTPTGQKVQDIANQTLAQVTAVHHEAKKIQVSRVT